MFKLTTSRLLCALVLMAVTSAVQAQSRRGLIRLTRIGPLVEVENKKGDEIVRTEYDATQNGERITEDNLVITTGENSRVILVFSNGATINVAADSQLDIVAFRQDPFAGEYSIADALDEPPARSRTEIYLKRGELVGNVKSLRDDSTFTVGTPAGSAGIRGTTFRVVFRPTGTGQAFFSVTTLEGDVGVTTHSGETEGPIGVLGAQEIELIVEVDDVTGEVTILTPPEEIVAATASPATLEEVSTAAQQSVEEVLEIVLTAEADQTDALEDTTEESEPEEAPEEGEEEDESAEESEDADSEESDTGEDGDEGVETTSNDFNEGEETGEDQTPESPAEAPTKTPPPTDTDDTTPGAGAG
jgi:hypothetical protein